MAQQPPTTPPPPPPPPQPPSGPGYGTGAPYARAGGVTAASVVLFVVGGIRSLLYLLAVVAIIGASGELTAFGVSGGQVAVGVFLALVALAAGILQIIGGASTLRLRRRGRTLALAGTIVGLSMALLAMFSGGGGGALVFGMLLIVGDIAIIVLLAQNSRHLVNP